MRAAAAVGRPGRAADVSSRRSSASPWSIARRSSRLLADADARRGGRRGALGRPARGGRGGPGAAAACCAVRRPRSAWRRSTRCRSCAPRRRGGRCRSCWRTRTARCGWPRCAALGALALPPARPARGGGRRPPSACAPPTGVEKIAFFEAFGRLAGAEGVSLLDRILNARSWLGRERAPEIRACAALALGRVRHPPPGSALTAAANDSDPVVTQRRRPRPPRGGLVTPSTDGRSPAGPERERSGAQRRGRDFLFAFHAALRALKLYPLENQAVQNALHELDQHARAVLGAEERGAASLRGRLLLRQRPATAHRPRQLRHLRRGGPGAAPARHRPAGGATRAPPREEWTAVLSLLLGDPPRSRPLRGLPRAAGARRAGARHPGASRRRRHPRGGAGGGRPRGREEDLRRSRWPSRARRCSGVRMGQGSQRAPGEARRCSRSSTRCSTTRSRSSG